jgi:hypothetical protein
VPWSLVHFVAAVVTGAALAVAHLSLVLTVVRDRRLVTAWKMAALLLPPVTPLAAWRSHHRRSALIWLVCVVAYALTRWVGA